MLNHIINRAGTPPLFPAISRRGLPAGAALLLAALFSIGSYAAWYHLSGAGRLPAEAVAALPQRLRPLAEQAAPLGRGVNTIRMPSAIAEAAAAAAAADPAPPAATTSPISAAAAQVPTRPADATSTAGLSPAPDATRILLRATADVWLMVKDNSGAARVAAGFRPDQGWQAGGIHDALACLGAAPAVADCRRTTHNKA